MIDDGDRERHPVDLLAEEFSLRLRRGEHPSIDEYAARYPEHAELIRVVFPSVALVERVSERGSSSSESPPRMPLAMPTSFGDFDIVRRIGSGGMGIVYEAIQRSLQRRVALKVMNGSSSEKSQHRIRFQREAEAAAGLHHTNIVPIYGIGEDHGLQYYAMQLIDGVTLHDVIESLRKRCRTIPLESSTTGVSSLPTAAPRRAGSSVSETQMRPAERYAAMDAASSLLGIDLPSDRLVLPGQCFTDNALAERQTVNASRTEPSMADLAMVSDDDGAASVAVFRPPNEYYRNVARIIAHAADALGYAHHCKVLHRDIKPANLLLDRDGTIWIADFGLARREDWDGTTQTGELLGTLRYMAPEQIRGMGDHRMDIYALGLTLFELLTLQYGLEAPKLRLSDPMGHSRIRFSKAMQRVVPRDLQTIVLKACNLAPEDRYQRATDFEEDLRRYLEDRSIKARRASVIEQCSRWARRNPTIATLGATSFGLLFIIAGLLAIWNRQQHQSLLAIQSEFDRAESNLKEKTNALQRASSEQSRAEKNMEMALEAFDQITKNVSARGGLLNALSMMDDDLSEFAEAGLTQADVDLLQSLQQFFDRFAEANAADLRVEAAVARRRVGEIQKKIGKLDEAAQSLQQAVAEFGAIRRAGQSEPIVMFEEIAARKELMLLLFQRGQLPRANSLFQETRKLLESDPGIRNSPEGKYALANLLGSIAASGSRFAPDRRRRPAVPWFNRPSAAVLPSPPPAQLARLKREGELNSEAIVLLEELVASDPNQTAFQVSLARAHKEHIRIQVGQGDLRAADQCMARARELMESLLKNHPDSAPFQYELAAILGNNIAFRPTDEAHCQQGLTLCDAILKDHPYVPEYQALKASILSRLALLGTPMADRGEGAIRRTNEAIAIQRDLAERFPEVAVYSIAWLQYQFQLSEIYFALKRPEKARAAMNDAAAVAERIQARGLAQPLVKSILDRIRDRRANLEAKNDG